MLGACRVLASRQGTSGTYREIGFSPDAVVVWLMPIPPAPGQIATASPIAAHWVRLRVISRRLSVPGHPPSTRCFIETPQFTVRYVESSTNRTGTSRRVPTETNVLSGTHGPYRQKSERNADTCGPLSTFPVLHSRSTPLFYRYESGSYETGTGFYCHFALLPIRIRSLQKRHHPNNKDGKDLHDALLPPHESTPTHSGAVLDAVHGRALLLRSP